MLHNKWLQKRRKVIHRVHTPRHKTGSHWKAENIENCVHFHSRGVSYSWNEPSRFIVLRLQKLDTGVWGDSKTNTASYFAWDLSDKIRQLELTGRRNEFFSIPAHYGVKRNKTADSGANLRRITSWYTDRFEREENSSQQHINVMSP